MTVATLYVATTLNVALATKCRNRCYMSQNNLPLNDDAKHRTIFPYRLNVTA
jgi:hypothetical protein